MTNDWSRNAILWGIGVFIGTASCTAPADEYVLSKARSTFTANGGFERAEGDELVKWQSRGNVCPEAVDRGWIRKTLRFNSGKHRRTDIFFYGNQGCIGSIWVDNFGCPKLEIKNASFEELNSNGRPASWDGDYEKAHHAGDVALFSDSTRASDGEKCIRLTFANEAVPCTRIWQNVELAPEQEYVVSYDCLVGDDFQGEVHSAAYSGSAHLTLDYSANSVNGLLETRDRCEKYAVAMTATAARPAEVLQEMEVPPEVNLEARMDVRNRTFKGMLTLVLEDVISGDILEQMDMQHIEATWQTPQRRFQSQSSKLRVRLSAHGEGVLQVDNVTVTLPTVVPPLQQARWLPASDNFHIPAQLTVSVRGRADKAVEGGLELLGNDLGRYGIVLERTGAGTPSLQILIGAEHEAQGKGDESYALAVNRKGIVVRAAKEPGAFYGLMTLLQLIEEQRGKPVVLACEIVDFPDMPMRGVLYGAPEQAARWKMNTFVESAGYPASEKQKTALSDSLRKCEKLNQKYIPYALAMMGGSYVQRINPNLAAGIWVTDEKVALKGVEPSPLANPYVIRTKLSDVQLKSPDGAEEYKIGVDYEVIDGDMAWNYDAENPKPFAVARLADSAIPDGSTVLASYDWVSHHRASDGRTQTHIAYVPLEAETRSLMDEFLSGLVREYPIPYTLYANCLHEFGPTECQLATDSRVIRSGKKPIQLFAEDISFQAAAVKEGNPAAKAMFWSGDMGNPHVRAAQPFVSRDAHAQIWGYAVNWPAAHGWEAIEYWSQSGFETSVMSWDNLRNVRGWAQVVATARAKGYPCLGMINACWHNRTGGLRETAIVSWKIPKEGERGFIELKTADRDSRRILDE